MYQKMVSECPVQHIWNCLVDIPIAKNQSVDKHCKLNDMFLCSKNVHWRHLSSRLFYEFPNRLVNKILKQNNGESTNCMW